MNNARTIVWFRQDLRLSDNPALFAAVSRGEVVPVYIWAPHEEGAWPPGAAQRYYLHQSLQALSADLHKRGSSLVLRTGNARDELRAVIHETGADAVYWNRRYEPAAIARDSQVKEALRKDGIQSESYNGSLLFEPWAVLNKQGKPYQVFTQYWKRCLAEGRFEDPGGEVKSLRPVAQMPTSATLDSLGLEPTIDWAHGIREHWAFGEASAWEALDRFLEQSVDNYDDARDLPALNETSCLSPKLHLGEISPRQVWKAVMDAQGGNPSKLAESYLSEIGWREFSYHLLYHFPHIPEEPLREKYASFPWDSNEKALRAWQKGQTGYPMVDAGMRQLWHTGWMHNRVRMVAASFLTKHLLIPWQEGARWFWDTLVDADLASNTQGWQWSAGCGADAQPYFRIFNPMTQGEKFDPDGEYVRRWVPEAASLPNKFIHRPWEAPREVLEHAGMRLGGTYPAPIIDHKSGRERALAAFQEVKAS